ncbi:MAG: hypothetical protein H6589_10480 [Flavobacteriales bacterium]|nr:hypothetical protein [Flavobacteriales bacterium]
MENNQPISFTPKSFIQRITIIHLALIIGLLLFAGVTYSTVETNVLVFDFDSNFFTVIVPAMAISMAFASNFIFTKKVNELSNVSLLKDKLMGYQTASIIRFALLEGPAMFSIVIYMLTGNLLFLIMAGVLIVYFITIRPTKEKIEMELNLNFEHKATFNQMDEEIK